MFKALARDKLFCFAVAGPCLLWLFLLLFYPGIRPLWQHPQPLGPFVLAVLVYPVLEETVFRGLIQGFLHKHGLQQNLLPGISSANITTSILFTAAHFMYHPWSWALPVIIPSLVFGHFRDKYQSIVPSIILHIYFNTGYFLLFS